MAKKNHDAIRKPEEQPVSAPFEKKKAPVERKGLQHGERLYPELDQAAPEWAVNFAHGLKHGSEVKRLGIHGNEESWTVAGVEEGGRVYLVEAAQEGKPPRHATMHAVEVALENRAASFGSELEKLWGSVLSTLETEENPLALTRKARIIGANKADIIYLAATRMTANPSLKAGAELLRAKDDLFSAVDREEAVANDKENTRIQSELSEGVTHAIHVAHDNKERRQVLKAVTGLRTRGDARALLTTERGMKGDEAIARALNDADLADYTTRLRDTLFAIDEADSALTHLRTASDVADKERQREEDQQTWGESYESGEGKVYLDDDATQNTPRAERGWHEAAAKIAQTRAAAAEQLIGLPSLRTEILDGLVEVDLQNPRTVEVIEADMNVLDNDISTLERAWKLHGKGDRSLPEVAVHFARIHALRQYEKSLLAERRTALELKKQQQDHALADVKSLWADTLTAIDHKQKQDQSISLLFRRDLELGADPKNIIGALEHILSSAEFNDLPASERRGCMLLFRALRKEHFKELIQDPTSPANAPQQGRQRIEDRLAARIAAQTTGAPTPELSVSAEGHGETIVTTKNNVPEAPKSKTRRARRTSTATVAGADPAKVIPFPSPAGAPQQGRQRIEDRLAAAIAAKEHQEAPPAPPVSEVRKAKRESPKKEHKDAYQPPPAVEKMYNDVPQVFPPVRDQVTDLDAWADVGARGAATTEGMATVRVTEPFRKFAEIFDGPDEFMKLHAEARAKTNLVRFSLEDLRNANAIQRWLYKRQMVKAAKEMLRQEEQKSKEQKALEEAARLARARRGKLQS